MYYEKIKRLDLEDIDNMTVSELQDVLRSGKQTLQKRRDQFDRSGQYSPAFEKFDPDDIITRGRKSLLKARAKEVVEKLNEQTTTRAGAREWKRNVKSALGLRDRRISDKQLKDIWEAFDKLREEYPNMEHILGSTPAVRIVSDIRIGSVDDMLGQMHDKLKEVAEYANRTLLTERQFDMLMGRRTGGDLPSSDFIEE